MSTRSLFVGASPRRLEAVLATAAQPRGVAVVCHPHPQFGGDMDTPVVRRVTDALVQAGWTTLRFNFGGVGESEGSYAGGTGEMDDVVAAVDAVRAADQPLLLVGYSFGAWVALRAVAAGLAVERLVLIGPPFDMVGWESLGALPASVPVSVVVGERDQFCDVARLQATPGLHAVRVLSGTDHYFGDALDTVAAAVVKLSF